MADGAPRLRGRGRNTSPGGTAADELRRVVAVGLEYGPVHQLWALRARLGADGRRVVDAAIVAATAAEHRETERRHGR